MVKRVSEAEWRGDLKSGEGDLALGSGAFKGAYSYKSRFESGAGTNPEELLAAAHAACFSMALSAALAQAGHKAESVRTKATVSFGPTPEGFAIERIDLETQARVPGIGEEEFAALADTAKRTCPVSKALAAVEIGLAATLR
ncbi:MAG: OsmC family peroxiredoxin [Alphaproteobacteria bacterium]|nr:OsmC family peroxiredoxin [Alphaproteobacteria bacterium]